MKAKRDDPECRRRFARLRERFQELQDTLAAIRRGQVDALIVDGPNGEHVFTLQGAEHPYRVLVETMNEGAATLAPSGTVLYANGRFAEMLGVGLQQLIGSSLESHVVPALKTELNCLVATGLQGSATGDIPFTDSRGKRRLLHLSLCPLVQPGLTAICVICSDRTALMEAKQALEASENGLRALSAQLLQSQDDERRRIARDLHDTTGQRIAAISMTLSQLIKRQADPMAQQGISECMGLADQVGSEIRTLSYLLHPPLLEELGLFAAIRWYAKGFENRTGIVVTLDVCEGLMRLSPDAEVALFRVIQESLTNAHRYSGTRSIRIRIRIHDETLVLEIADFGKGVSRDEVPARETATVGLGIQSMRERMRLLSGSLEMTDTPGGGTTVLATLPLRGRVMEVESPEDPALCPLQLASQAEESGTKRILIADDHQVLRHGVRNLLAGEESWTICGEATDGQDAVNKTLTLEPDLVILDIAMPVLNGVAALRKILTLRPQTRVLVFTAHDSDSIAKEVVTAGACGYLPKARAGDDLIRAVKAIFEGRSFTPATAAVQPA